MCTGDSGVEPQAKGNLTQIKWIHASSRLPVIPSTDFGREHHPPGCWFECKPSVRFAAAAIEFHLEYLHAGESTISWDLPQRSTQSSGQKLVRARLPLF